MSTKVNPDRNPAKTQANIRTRTIEILSQNEGMSPQQAQLQAKEELKQESASTAPSREEKTPAIDPSTSEFSDKSNNSAISANTPGSLNTGTGGQSTNIESGEIENSTNPLTNLYSAIDNLKDRSISFIPKAGQELKAVVLHVESCLLYTSPSPRD